MTRDVSAALRPTLDAPDDDPRLWLEEVEGDAAVSWVETQNAATFSTFADRQYEQDRDALAEIFDRPDRIPVVSRRGDALYNFWQDSDHPRGVWRRTTLASYRTATPQWEILLDLDALAEKEGEDWTWWRPAATPDHRKAVLALSRGGGDANVLREFDLQAKDFVPGGFDLPEAKGNAQWLDDDALLLSSAYGADMATEAGYARTVRLWSRGQPVEASEVLFETAASNMQAFAYRDRTQPEEVVWFVEAPSFFDQIINLGDRNGPKQRLALPTDAKISGRGSWIAASRRGPWTIGERTYPPGSVFGASLALILAGTPDFTLLFEPQSRRTLESHFFTKDRLVLSILDDMRPVFELWTPGCDGWRRTVLKGVPDDGVADLWPLASSEHECDGTLLGSVQDPTRPPELLMIAPDDITVEGGTALAAPEVLRRTPASFDSTGLATKRLEATSSDGASIPYTITGPEAASGDAPVLLKGYGGFEISVLPRYDQTAGKLWLERGGTVVTAHIRGGGEFGPEWHAAGRREGKRQSHDDFAAIAQDLVQRGVTTPGRIAAEGGSNGGLLIANMLTRYPERFGALFCTVPLIDMRRYSKLLAGASWIAEYGDPDVEADWRFLQHMSAYHAAEPGKAYPPILIATTRRDDRVHPGHARKMAAKLQELGYDASYFEPAAGGHSYGKDNKERAAFAALGMRFLRRKLQWG